MKKTTLTLAATLFSICLATGAHAAGMDHSGHQMNHDMGQGATGHAMESMDGQEMAGGQHLGHPIRQTTVDGYQLQYELIDMKAQMGDGGGHQMPAEMKSHHLMVYVIDPQGQKVTDAKTGYLVSGPDGEQKAMTMSMSGGYGADVDLEPAGTYTVKTKVMTPDGKKLMDEFTYEAK